MMNVKVLGGGCAKCNALENNAIEALKELNVEYELEHFIFIIGAINHIQKNNFYSRN